MINSQSVPNLQNSNALPISEPSLEQINKKQYGDTLRQQIEQKKMREQQEKIQERLMELQLQNPSNNLTRGGGGAPLRDQYGNITTTRRNPMDPNISSAQIFGPQISSVQFNQPDYLSVSQYPIQPQRMVSTNQSMINLPIQNNSQLSQIGEQIAQAEKRQKKFVLQRELLQQIDITEKKKQEEKLKIKRDKELDDLRILREREEQERRMKDEFGIDKLEKRNLQQTNFDVDGLKALKRLEMLKYQNELIEQQNKKNAKTGARQRTPIQEAEKAYRDQKNDMMQSRIEQRIIKELPIEVEKTVRDTINVELHRLRQEMNLQTNQVSEQVVSLKSQLMKANEHRHYNEEQIRKLKDELRSTQIIDEIRQRELYQAFQNQERTRQIIESAQRLQTPDVIKYAFPRRQKLNQNDPFLVSNDEVNKDLYGIITDSTQIQPLTRGGGGAPLRDQYGNITTTRRNPMDPNISSAQIFGPQISSVQFNQPDYLSVSQYPIQPQRMVSTNQSMINLPIQNNSQLSQIGEQIAQAEKRQKKFVLQRELLQQIDITEKKKQEEKLKIKRDKELDDLRILREREEQERRMKDEFGIDKLEKRNLQQTNFDVDGLKALKRLEMLKYQNELIEQQNKKNAKTGARQRTPIQEAEKAYRDQKNDMMQSRIEQRIIKELPIEVEKTVRDTINVELHRLRQEMNLQTNQVSEQVVSLKSQLMKANEHRHYNEEQIRKLKDELRSTQIIDEIRQRELYQAFQNQERTRQIIESAQRLQTPDVIKYAFPRRQKLNQNDPFLVSNDEVNKDLYGIITDSTQIQPTSFNKQTKEMINEQRLNNNKEDDTILNYRSGLQINQNEFDMPEDYQNRSQLYIAKNILDSKPVNNYDYSKIENNSMIPKQDYISLISNTHPYYIQEEDEIKNVIQKYSSKLERLEDIDLLQQKRDFNQMDYALQDLLDQQSIKLNKHEYINDPIEYNDYYSTDYQDKNFYIK
ncbi:unnamed protein product [Paramecium sonneborni]|uniref:Uncharacterized protein n=1 Tax=Paramecium sonneborni TaxID=65129 RepID=A0A8S1L1Y1_9CILI|nr:unnamed protein product [Paramecium sonneborni]